jgi:uncharacterized RDD family membrane protein YckC
MNERPPPASYLDVLARTSGPAEAQCPSCGRPSIGNLCRDCGQVRDAPSGTYASSILRRLIEFMLDLLLVIVTFFIGWLVWSLIVWKNGQTPAKQLLHMRTVRLDTGQRATWATMCLRELVAKWLLVFIVIGSLTGGLGSTALCFMLCWDVNRQQLWDKIAKSIVVDDPAP